VEPQQAHATSPSPPPCLQSLTSPTVLRFLPSQFNFPTKFDFQTHSQMKSDFRTVLAAQTQVRTLVILTAVTRLAALVSLVILATKQSAEAAHTPCCSDANLKQPSDSGDSAYRGYYSSARYARLGHWLLELAATGERMWLNFTRCLSELSHIIVTKAHLSNALAVLLYCAITGVETAAAREAATAGLPWCDSGCYWVARAYPELCPCRPCSNESQTTP
jgi:hypothetical protein